MRTLFAIAIIFIGILTLSAAPRTDVIADVSYTAVQVPDHAINDGSCDDCTGSCLFCDHCNTCTHSHSASVALAMPMIEFTPTARLVVPGDHASPPPIRVHGPYRPPRA